MLKKSLSVLASLVLSAGVAAAIVPLGNAAALSTAVSTNTQPEVWVSPMTVDINDGLSASEVATGSRLSCALSDGSVYCWGSTYYGVVGNGTAESGQINYRSLVVDGDDGFTNTNVTAIAAGNGVTCAIEDGSLYCWGVNTYGQLGDGTTTNSASPVKVADNATTSPAFVNADITDVAVGPMSVCAVRDIPGSGAGTGDHLYCWGYNQVGELGFTSTTNCDSTLCELVPTLVTGTTDLPNDGSEEITGLVSEDVRCAISGGEVACWGQAYEGKLGRSGLTESTVYPPTNIDDNGGEGFTNSSVTLLAGDREVYCAVASGEVFCWGSNESAALGNNPTDVANGDYEELAVKVSDNADEGFTNAGVTAIDIGGGYGGPSACAIASGSVYCWGGDGVDAQNSSILSVPGPDTCGSDECAKKPVKVADGEMVNSDVTDISLSPEHACAVKSSTVFCWGSQGEGQLGLGGSLEGDDAYQNPHIVYDAGPPTVTSVDPTSFGAGDTVTFTGTELTSATLVWVDGWQFSSAGNVCEVSDATGTSLTCTFGEELTGGESLYLRNPRSLSAWTNTNDAPEYEWTGLMPRPTLEVGQCAGGSLGVRVSVVEDGGRVMLAADDGDMMFYDFDLEGVEAVDGAIEATFTEAMVYDFDTDEMTPVALEFDVEYRVSGVYEIGDDFLNIEGVAITLTDGGSTADCPVGAASNDSSSDSSSTTVPGSSSATPTLVTSSNQELLTASAGSAKIVINGELVDVELVQASEELRRTVGGARTFEQVRALQALAEDMVAAVQAVLGEGVTLPITVTNVDTGATISGLVTDPVTSEPLAVPVEDVLLIVNESIALMVGGADGTNNPANIAFDGVLEFGEGGYVAVLAYGLTPGAAGEVVVMSTPQLLDTFTVDTDGGVAAQAAIPADLAPGEHTVVVAVDGKSASLGFRVLSAGTLPVTGGSSSLPSALAVLLAAAGAFGVLVVSRRRHTT